MRSGRRSAGVGGTEGRRALTRVVAPPPDRHGAGLGVPMAVLAGPPDSVLGRLRSGHASPEGRIHGCYVPADWTIVSTADP